MRAGFIVFDGMTLLDFVGVYDPLTRLVSMGLDSNFKWEICGPTPQVRDDRGTELFVTHVARPLDVFDLIVVAGGFSTRSLTRDSGFINWLRSANTVSLKTSVCTGSLLLGAAGFLTGIRATTHHTAMQDLACYCREVCPERIVDEGSVITAAGVSASID